VYINIPFYLNSKFCIKNKEEREETHLRILRSFMLVLQSAQLILSLLKHSEIPKLTHLFFFMYLLRKSSKDQDHADILHY
jgi:hypothetical protein